MSTHSKHLCKLSIIIAEDDHSRHSDNVKSKLIQWWDILTSSYPRYNETTQLLHQMQSNFPNLVKVYSVGKSVEGKELWVIQLSQNVTQGRPLLRPMVKIVANMHGDETLGRQLTLLLAAKILRGYENQDLR